MLRILQPDPTSGETRLLLVELPESEAVSEIVIRNMKGEILALPREQLTEVLAIARLTASLPGSTDLTDRAGEILTDFSDLITQTKRLSDTALLALAQIPSTTISDAGDALNAYYQEVVRAVFTPGKVSVAGFASGLLTHVLDGFIDQTRDQLAAQTLQVAVELAEAAIGNRPNLTNSISLFSASNNLASLVPTAVSPIDSALESSDFGSLDRGLLLSWTLPYLAQTFYEIGVELQGGTAEDFILDEFATVATILAVQFPPLAIAINVINLVDNSFATLRNLFGTTSAQAELQAAFENMNAFWEALANGSFSSPDAMVEASELAAEFVTRGTKDDDRIRVIGEGQSVAAGAGNDTIIVNSARVTDFGDNTVIGGPGNDVVALHGVAYDPDKLVQRPGGGFLYRVDSENTLALSDVESLYFFKTGEYVPLDTNAAIFAVRSFGGLVEVLSATAYEVINSDHTGNNLTVDANGLLASAGFAYTRFTNSGGYTGSLNGIRVTGVDVETGGEERSDFWIGDYAWTVDPDAFEHVPGFGEIALTGPYYFTRGGGNELGSGAIVALPLRPGLEDDEVTWLQDAPLGHAEWYYGNPSPSDPVSGSGGSPLVGQPADTATFNGKLVALSSYFDVSTGSLAQRLITIHLPPGPETSYHHLVFLDAAVKIEAIAYNEVGDLLGVGRPNGSTSGPQILYLIDTTSGASTALGEMPTRVNDFVVSGTVKELLEFLAPVTVDPDPPNLFAGTDDADRITGTVLNDTIAGQGGDDIIFCGIGDDRAEGGPGNDSLSGALGDDLILGQGGNDYLQGFSGFDTLVGGNGCDILVAEKTGLYHIETSAQIFRLYAAVFGREPDVGGQQGWVLNLLGGGFTLDQAAAAFVASPEFQAIYGATAAAQFMTLLYQNVFGRTPATAEVDSWVANLTAGMSRAEVVRRFSESPEHKILTGTDQQAYDLARDPTEWVDDVFRLFRAIFDREPDEAGFVGWIDNLASGNFTFEAVISQFMASPEFQATYGTTDNTLFVTLLYQNVLKREPDTNGLNGWTANLNGGMTREKVVERFMASPEFVNATAADVLAYVESFGSDDTLFPGPGCDVVSGGLFADTFVFTDDGVAGTVTVTDVEPWDVLDFSAFGLSEAQVLAAMSQSGVDVVFNDGTETVVFANTNLGELTQAMLLV